MDPKSSLSRKPSIMRDDDDDDDSDVDDDNDDDRNDIAYLMMKLKTKIFG